MNENERENEQPLRIYQDQEQEPESQRYRQQQKQQQIQIRAIEPLSHTRVSILIVDRQLSLSVELNDEIRKLQPKKQ